MTIKHKTIPTLLLLPITMWLLPASSIAEDLIRLDFKQESATNSGNFGKGTVNGGAWSWEEVDPKRPLAGHAFSTGADGMGSFATNGQEAGSISWSKRQANMDKMAEFSFYAWLRPMMPPDGAARLLSYGNMTVLDIFTTVAEGKARLGVKINGKQKYPAFMELDDSAVGKWLFVGMSFDKGTVSVFIAPADSEDLSPAAEITGYFDETLNESTGAGLILLNGDSSARDRPFAGSLGGFYLSDNAMHKADFESIFDTQKVNFVSSQ